MDKYCFVSLVTTERYLPFVIKNAEAFKYFNIQYPYIIMIPKDNEIIKNCLEYHNIQYKEISIDKFYGIGPFVDTINKFKILLMDSFEKICFLDADILIINKNIEKIFNFLTQDFAIAYEIRGNGKKEICGQCWLCRPNQKLYNKIMDFIFYFNTKNGYHDELILEKLINSYSTNYINIEFFHNNFIHFSGGLKSTEKNKNLFSIFYYFFYNATIKELFNFFDIFICQNYNERDFIQSYEQ